MLLERAYAKVNLSLDVLGERPDGYHEVDMVLQSVDLSDAVWLAAEPGDSIRIESSSTQMPLDERNLAYQAARAFLGHAEVRRAVTIGIEKRIPIAAGLGGGSADAAAVLRGLNRLLGTGFTPAELAEIGASVGSDVPFCVYNGCAVATGRGERLQRVHHDLRVWAVLLRPPVFVSTADVYRAVGEPRPRPVPSSSQVVQALQAADFDALCAAVQNDLRDVAEALYPEIAAHAERMETIACQRVYMSGSGPTLFALAPTQAKAQRIYNGLRGFMKEVYLCRFV
ncbi:MAG: 4-(cytidine 5'-diphospho)-2-C-methyl-D-erythritol kinase [Alicyclobacillus sp.]|nr:4-(cytidine 5'-diphospho)-2-C-methyl-D-erythritol kinase [Alicyclobacillus sp.]